MIDLAGFYKTGIGLEYVFIVYIPVTTKGTK